MQYKFLPILFMLTILLPSICFSYPLFYKCDENNSLSSHLSTQELNTLINNNEENNPEVWKSHLIDCLDEQTQLLQLALVDDAGLSSLKIEARPLHYIPVNNPDNILCQLPPIQGALDPATGDDVEQMLQLQKGFGHMQIKKLLEEIATKRRQVALNSSSSIRELGHEIHACRQQMKSHQPDWFKADKSDETQPSLKERCLINYPFHSPYSYATGVRGANSNDDRAYTRPVRCSDLKHIIDSSVLAGTDPLAMLGIAFLEGPADKVGSLKLDPHGFKGVLGCSDTKRVNEDNPELLSFIEEYARMKGREPVSAPPRYYCIGGTWGSSKLQSSPGSCCVKVPFSTGEETSNPHGGTNWVVRAALSYWGAQSGYLGVSSRYESQGENAAERLAHRIQTFNGTTPCTGCYGSQRDQFPAWRSGLNFRTSPAYGNQAMDYVLNSFDASPVVQAMITDAQERLGKKAKSQICEMESRGTFSLESESFFEKVKNSPRFDRIAANHRAGRSLTEGQQHALDRELRAAGTTNKSVYFNNRSSYDTLGEANQRDQGYTWGRLRDSDNQQIRRSLSRALGN